MTRLRDDPIRWLTEQPLVLIAAYYLIVVAAAMVVDRVAPALLMDPPPGQVDIGTILTDAGPPPSVIAPIGKAVFAMIVALLLMVPVAWVYLLSRRKRGYQQSLMHTLIILPIVVAGVVILVKTSIALAFSLGGIVGAIAFRNRLEDTKDAVHVFVAIGVGLACGVDGFAIGLALSFLYNVVNVVLWMGDIGRTPPGLAGPPAQARLEVLKAGGGGGDKGSEAFVSQIDSLLLKSMSPDQLESLGKRADKRRRKGADEEDVEAPAAPDNGKAKRRVRIRVEAPADQLKGRRGSAEPVLDRLMKEWRLEKSSTENGKAIIVYEGKMKKRSEPSNLAAEVKSAMGAVDKVEVLDA